MESPEGADELKEVPHAMSEGSGWKAESSVDELDAHEGESDYPSIAEPVLLSLYDKNDALMSEFFEWRHKILTRFALTVGRLGIAINACYTEKIRLPLAELLFVAGILVSLGARAMDTIHQVRMQDTYDNGYAIEARLRSAPKKDWIRINGIYDGLRPSEPHRSRLVRPDRTKGPHSLIRAVWPLLPPRVQFRLDPSQPSGSEPHRLTYSYLLMLTYYGVALGFTLAGIMYGLFSGR